MHEPSRASRFPATCCTRGTRVAWRGAMVASLMGAAIFLLSATSLHAEGGIFVTGHDPDFHAYQGSNTAGAQHIIQQALNFVTDGHSGKVLLVTSLINPGGGYSYLRLGLQAAGLSFDVADDGSAGGSVLNLHTVNLSAYSAIVVASDFGGWLRQSELNILLSRESDLLNYVNAGGGLIAFAESGPPLPGLLTSNAFGYLPFLVSALRRIKPRWATRSHHSARPSVFLFPTSMGMRRTTFSPRPAV